jgi:predicted transcriptional regulator
VLLALADGRARPLSELAREVAALLGRPVGSRAVAARLSELRDLGLVERADGGWRIRRPP